MAPSQSAERFWPSSFFLYNFFSKIAQCADRNFSRRIGVSNSESGSAVAPAAKQFRLDQALQHARFGGQVRQYLMAKTWPSCRQTYSPDPEQRCQRDWTERKLFPHQIRPPLTTSQFWEEEAL